MPNDLELLQGAWAIARLELDGQEQPAPSEARIEIQDDRFTSRGLGPVYSGRIELNTKPTPHHIDLRFDSGPEAGNVNHGIYEVQRGGWRMCLNMQGAARPNEFATAPGSGCALEVLKTAPKAKKIAPDKAAAVEAAAASAPATEIEGEWRMVSGVMNGAVMDDATIAWVRRTNRGNISTVTAGPQTMLEVEFTLDPSQTPAYIDYVVLAGPQKGKTQAGIYAFEKGLLQICVAAPGGGRPRTFDSAKGDGRTFTVWKKA